MNPAQRLFAQQNSDDWYQDPQTGESFRLVDGDLLVCPADYSLQPVCAASTLRLSRAERRRYERIKKMLLTGSYSTLP